MNKELRSLSAEEIAQLTAQGCFCENWPLVSVADGFKPERVKSTYFSGQVTLGVFEKRITFEAGLEKTAGISNATIHNCRIGNNVYIDHVKNYIANYVIEDDVVIANIDMLTVEGKSSFGNGTQVVVINEAGGREIPIYDNLSAHTAYVIALYRDRPKVIENLKKMIASYTASVTSSMGLVAKDAKITNCRIIKNVKIGQASSIEGVNRLENGSVNSCSEAPVYIGPAVLAENFIVCSGSTITDGTIICNCFIGQGCELGKQYSAENSVFFANCLGFHGEACSIFAGPYTVTHHKSTMLIAGLFSFLNAGSGTNQSNHMYKLGPVHQGIIERGSKTGSDSYLLWPAKVGAFTAVMGRHYKNSDTSDLPFSYLIEHEDESILIPGVNLRSVGTVRDARKWPKRDKRKDPVKLDSINFKLLSPWTVQKMLKGQQVLTNLKITSGETSDYFTYKSVKIKKSSLENGIKFYKMGIDKFLGNCLIKQLKDKQPKNIRELKSALTAQTNIGTGKWLDLAGLFAPQEIVQSMLSEIEAGKLKTLKQIDERFKAMHDEYGKYEWAWVAGILQQQLGKTVEKITADDIIKLIERWKSAVLKLDSMLYSDAHKEFSVSAQIGFGLDDEKSKQADFAAVSGTFEENSFVCEIEKHMAEKSKLANEIIEQMKNLQE